MENAKIESSKDRESWKNNMAGRWVRPNWVCRNPHPARTHTPARARGVRSAQVGRIELKLKISKFSKFQNFRTLFTPSPIWLRTLTLFWALSAPAYNFKKHTWPLPRNTNNYEASHSRGHHYDGEDCFRNEKRKRKNETKRNATYYWAAKAKEICARARDGAT